VKEDPKLKAKNSKLESGFSVGQENKESQIKAE
jgi:hypothetical protein